MDKRGMPNYSSLTLVVDTNIWIYLYYSDLVAEAFVLGRLHVPDLTLTMEPLTELTWDELRDKGVSFDGLASDDMRTVKQITSMHKDVSVCDVACLVLSERMQVPLVTDDKDLRRLASSRHARLHSFDDLLALMVGADIISRNRRQEAIESLVAQHQRPPR